MSGVRCKTVTITKKLIQNNCIYFFMLIIIYMSYISDNDAAVNRKKEFIRNEILKPLKEKAQYNLSKYKKYRLINNIVIASTSFLSAASIGLLISGLVLPPLLIASGVSSGCVFVLNAVNQSLDIQDKRDGHQNTLKNSRDMIREIELILIINHLTPEMLDEMIEQLQGKINLIESTELF